MLFCFFLFMRYHHVIVGAAHEAAAQGAMGGQCLADGIFKARNKHSFLWKEPLKEEFMMKLNEKLLVMIVWLRNALSLLLIRIPMALPFAILEVVWCGLFALLAYALGKREDARYFMNCISKMFTIAWESTKLEFSVKEILNDYCEIYRKLYEEEP